MTLKLFLFYRVNEGTTQQKYRSLIHKKPQQTEDILKERQPLAPACSSIILNIFTKEELWLKYLFFFIIIISQQ